MNLLPGTKRIVASEGDLETIGTAGQPIRLFSVHLVSAATSSTLKLHNLASGATSATSTWVQVDGAATQGSTLNFAGGIRFPLGMIASIDSSLSFATITYTEEF